MAEFSKRFCFVSYSYLMFAFCNFEVSSFKVLLATSICEIKLENVITQNLKHCI